MNNFELIDALKAITKRVGAFQLREINRVSSDRVETKELNSLVSYVDKQSELMIVEKLLELIPNSGFITEEDVIENSNKPFTWIIDPLDGTTNYLHEIPHYSISIALRHNDMVILGIVYLPSLDECFYAVKNEGAFLNGKPIMANTNKALSESLVGTGFPYRNSYNVEARFEAIKYWLMNTRGIRRMGSAALDLVYVACGRLDIYYEGPLNIWDLAAGALIAEEAGARVSDMDGSANHLNSGYILAANNDLYDEIFDVVSKSY